MPKGKGVARKNINFRQTHSERAATSSYRNFGRYLKNKFYRKDSEQVKS